MSLPIRTLAESRPILSELPEAASTEAEALLSRALGHAARADGNRVLDAVEAEAVRAAVALIVPTGSEINVSHAAQLESVLAADLASLRASRIRGADVLFTSQGNALKTFRAKIMGAINDTIDKADGRPVDINMMLFSFTDKVMADEIVELARNNPHVTFRLLTDWSQLATSGGRQPPRLAFLAQREGLDNLQVRFKKDNPYVWSDSKERPVFSHSGTKGLNHHKGFVTLIDGQPERLLFGSFNWSLGAMKRNYENLMSLDRADSSNRRIMESYDEEFGAFWNNDDASLSYFEARDEKNRIFEALYSANGVEFDPAPVSEHSSDREYYAPERVTTLDINSFLDDDVSYLSQIVGADMAEKVVDEVKLYGRFASWTDLLSRVPALADEPRWAREQLRDTAEFGLGTLSINTATVDALERAGFSSRLAERIVAFREDHGAFESVAELDAVKGIGPKTIERLEENLNDDEVIVTFSARVPGESATTGYAEGNRGHMSVPTHGMGWPGDIDGNGIADNRDELESIENNMAAPVIDMLRRAPAGETFRLAVYGMSARSPEYKAMREALERGVKVRVVIYAKYNGKTIDALEGLKAEGFDVDTRVIKSRVMHEKFGVVGDDVFNGSANLSTSSITKHSEDRFLFRNRPNLADRFVEEFSRLWDRGNPAH